VRREGRIRNWVYGMTTIEITLPDDLAKIAKTAGLLSDSAIQGLLEEAIRRRSGKALLDVARRIQAAEIPAMSDDDIVAEVKAVRSARRARTAEADRTLTRAPGADADCS